MIPKLCPAKLFAFYIVVKNSMASVWLLILPKSIGMDTLNTNGFSRMTLETETTRFWPEHFQTCFKGIFYWNGVEQREEFADERHRCAGELLRYMVIWLQHTT